MQHSDSDSDSDRREEEEEEREDEDYYIPVGSRLEVVPVSS